jgi:uncharacterized protein YqkB
MFLKMDEFAREKIQDNLDHNGQIILMTVADGVSPLDDPADVSMATMVSILITDLDVEYLPWFNDSIDTQLGPFLIKGYTRTLFSEEMRLHKKNDFGGAALDGQDGRISDDVIIKKVTR